MPLNNGQEMTKTMISLAQAHDLTTRALMAARTCETNAESVARALVAAERDGQSGHGLTRIPSYCAQSLSGKVDGSAKAELTWLTDVAARIDVAFGFAYPAFDLAIEALSQRAETQGICVATLYRSHHFGQAGAHCERFAERGLVAFVYGNSPKAMAPWGGKRALIGTNPIAFAAPMKEAPPLVVDLALSKVARGKVIAAREVGQEIPNDWAFDVDGKPTTDPEAVLAGGTMRPIGQAKGAALAIMVEVMSACLAGAHLGFEASNLFDADGPPPNLGQSVLVLNPQLLSGGQFLDRMAAFAEAYDAEEGVRLPGLTRLKNRRKAETAGLAIDPILFGKIEAIIEQGV